MKRSQTAHGKVPVAADAAVGPMTVDVTINYGLTTQVVSVMGVIQPPDAND